MFKKEHNEAEDEAVKEDEIPEKEIKVSTKPEGSVELYFPGQLETPQSSVGCRIQVAKGNKILTEDAEFKLKYGKTKIDASKFETYDDFRVYLTSLEKAGFRIGRQDVPQFFISGEVADCWLVHPGFVAGKKNVTEVIRISVGQQTIRVAVKDGIANVKDRLIATTLEQNGFVLINKD